MSLNICGIGHRPVCFEGSPCPFCHALEEQEKYFIQRIENLKSKIKELEVKK